ncbi:hypothetical protein BDW71DRAFT_13761 [Aspergillus fruticulosus]
MDRGALQFAVVFPFTSCGALVISFKGYPSFYTLYTDNVYYGSAWTIACALTKAIRLIRAAEAESLTIGESKWQPEGNPLMLKW